MASRRTNGLCGLIVKQLNAIVCSFIQYFTSLISGSKIVNPAPINLKSVSFYNFPIGKMIILKIYERMRPVYTSEKL